MRVGVLFMNEDSVVRDCRGGIVISTYGLSEHNILKPILKPSVAFPTPVPMTAPSWTAHVLLASACIGFKTSR